MKAAIFLVSILGCSFALPSNNKIDWSKIQPEYAFVQPKSNLSEPIAPRVVGGTESVPNSRPYQAALIIDGRRFCGASLISNTFVITAAHCIEGTAYIQIILGAHDITAAESTQIVITSTNVLVHPDYNRLNYNNDVGLVRFPNAVTFNQNIRSVTLASEGTFVGFQGTLSGWGRVSDAASGVSPRLNEVDLTIIQNTACRQIYGEEFVRDTNLCTSGEGGVGGCDGDSGSPLVVETVQVAVASFVAGSGCQAGFPTGYARITSFRNWIVQNSDIV